MRTICLALASVGLVAATAAGAADEAPPPLSVAFEENLQLGPVEVIGQTPNGREQFVQVTGGGFSGPGVSGRVLPGGGDFQVVRSDGSVTIDAEFTVETDDHVMIRVRNLGVAAPSASGAKPYAWLTPKFDAPAGRYAWLNDTVFVGRISPGGDKDHRGVRITVFKVG